MSFLKKAIAGSDSFGNIWPEDGAVVEVDAEQAIVLLSIPDAGFSELDPDQIAALRASKAISESPEPETPAKAASAKAPAAPRGRTVKE